MRVLHVTKRAVSHDLRELGYGPDLDHFKALATLLEESHVACRSAEGTSRSVRVKENLVFHLAPGMLALAFLVLRLARRFDLIVSQNPFAAGLIALVAGLAWRKPVMVTVHGFDFAYDLRDSWKFRLEFPLRRIVVRLASLLRADSTPVARVLLSWGAPKERLVVLGSRVDCERFTPEVAGENFRAKLGLGSRPAILFAGSLTKIKGVDTLLRAAQLVKAAFPDVVFLLAGEGPLRTTLEREIRRLGLERNVILLGRIRYAQMPQLMAAAHLLVHPSRTESIGRVLLEAQAAGKPVVASKVGGVVEAVREGETAILVPPEDHRALADAIVKLASSRQLAEDMGKSGRRYVLAHYEFWSQERRLVELYSRAVKSRRKAA